MNTVSGFLLILTQVCVTQQAKLEGSDSQIGDKFGVSVDLFKDRIVVGAPENFPLTVPVRTGAAYVFELVGGAWQQQAQLTPSNAPTKGYFGHAVACDASRVVVGASQVFPTSVPSSRGLAYVYTKLGNAWVEEAMIDPQDPMGAKAFGTAVDLDGDTIIVGAPDSGPGAAGAAYVYFRAGSTWTQQAKLMASAPKLGSRFGFSAVIDGDTAVVGAIDADGVVPSTGAAYVFTRVGSNWTQTQKLVASTGKSQDRFGWSVDIDGSTLVVGASEVDTGWWEGHGSAYVFGWNGQQWQGQQQLKSRGYSKLDHAGRSVALDGGTLAFGAPDVMFTPGTVHIYSHSPPGWLQHLMITSKDGYFGSGTGYSSWLGQSMSIQGSRLVAGAGQADGAFLPKTGAAYVFEIQMQNPQPTFFCLPKADSKGCTPRFYHFRVPSVSAALNGQSYLIRGWDVPPNVPGMVLYSTTGPANVPFAGGSLCIQPPIRRTPAELTTENGMLKPCNGHFAYDFNAWIASGNDPSLTAGQPVWMQYWYRDPTSSPGTNVGLTDGIFVEICP